MSCTDQTCLRSQVILRFCCLSVVKWNNLHVGLLSINVKIWHTHILLKSTICNSTNRGLCVKILKITLYLRTLRSGSVIRFFHCLTSFQRRISLTDSVRNVHRRGDVSLLTFAEFRPHFGTAVSPLKLATGDNIKRTKKNCWKNLV